MFCYIFSLILVIGYMTSTNAPTDMLLAAGLFAIAGAIGWRTTTIKNSQK